MKQLVFFLCRIILSKICSQIITLIKLVTFLIKKLLIQ